MNPAHFRLPASVREISEIEPKRQLHNARGTRRVCLAEPPVHLFTSWVEERRRVDRKKLGMVEQVVRLPAKLEKPRFTLQVEALHQRSIPVIEPGAPDRRDGRIAETALRRPRKSGGVEPLLQASIAVR